MFLDVRGVSRTVRKENPANDVFAEKFTPERKKVGSHFGLQDLRHDLRFFCLVVFFLVPDWNPN